MPMPPDNLLAQGAKIAREQIAEAVRTRYFPEIWYAIEHWFQLTKGRRALEVGFGLGLVGEALAKSGWQVTLVDDTVANLDYLKARFEANKLSGEFAQTDPDKLPFANSSFDVIASINTLEFTQNPHEGAREIARVLAPGGRALIATFNRLSPWGIAPVARCIRQEDSARLARFLSKDEFQQVLRASGLVVEQFKGRAHYLPAGAAKIRLPIAGAFIALVTKDKAPSKASGRKSSTP